MFDPLFPIRRDKSDPRSDFWHTLRWGLIAAAFIWLLVHAGSTRADTISINGTNVTLQATAQHGAIAELVMNNVALNSHKDDGAYALTHDGLNVSVEFHWTAGDDSIRVTVPPGYIADPDSIAVEENATGVIHIFSIESIGM